MKTTLALSSFCNAFENATKGKELPQTFDDFLTLCMYFIAKKSETDVMYYQQEYVRISEAYKQAGTFDYLIKLPSLFFNLPWNKTFHTDILGEFYMSVIAPEDNRAILSPFLLCIEMTELFSHEAAGSVCILDTAVGTGRMLLAFRKNSLERHRYYGMETNPVLAKLATINMFLHNLSGEIICAEDSDPENFKAGYRISGAPKDIFRINAREDSKIWLMNKDVFGKMRKDHPQKRLLFF